mmetsp:Transcript_10926/g.13820  ORF Transcript_10926/g.13820 Transcript_10926/m.13820 type:complete len:89 (+) Transcript_10926:26-292(+)
MLVDLSSSITQANWVHLATDIGMEKLDSIVLKGVGYTFSTLFVAKAILSAREAINWWRPLEQLVRSELLRNNGIRKSAKRWNAGRRYK